MILPVHVAVLERDQNAKANATKMILPVHVAVLERDHNAKANAILNEEVLPKDQAERVQARKTKMMTTIAQRRSLEEEEDEDVVTMLNELEYSVNVSQDASGI